MAKTEDRLSSKKMVLFMEMVREEYASLQGGQDEDYYFTEAIAAADSASVDLLMSPAAARLAALVLHYCTVSPAAAEIAAEVDRQTANLFTRR